MTSQFNLLLEGRNFQRTQQHPSGLDWAARLVPHCEAGHGYEDAFDLPRKCLLTIKNLTFDQVYEDTVPGRGRLILWVHLRGYRIVEFPDFGRFELRTPTFAVVYHAPGVRMRSVWLSGGMEMSVMAGFAVEDPPLQRPQARQMMTALAQEFLDARPFFWMTSPLDAQAETTARSLMTPAVRRELLLPYLELKAQELVYLGLSKLLSSRSPPIAQSSEQLRLDDVLRIVAQDSGRKTTTQIAESLGVSVNDLNARFRRSYGCSLHEHIATSRITYSRVLLEQSQLPLKEIAYRAGYRHVSNFCIAYKRHFGLTPSETRRRAASVTKLSGAGPN